MHEEMDKNKLESGLYIVSTPIGNLSDITFRAIEILNNSDYIFCEDTRVAKKLLTRYQIKSTLISNHKFNEKKNTKKISELLSEGKIISLISDAGTPLISDPGKLLLNNCVKNKINVVPVPGPSAVTAAISICGFSNNFYFLGFLPEKINQIEKKFKDTEKLDTSLIFFISAKKINKIIPLLKKYFNERKIVICREITKFYEEFIREDIKNLKKEYYFKGEITVVISNKQEDKKNLNIINESDKIKINILINKMSVKNIVEIFSKEANVSKSTIYNYCLRIKNEK